MNPIIHLDRLGSGGGSGTGYIGVFDNYTALITAFPTAPTLSLAYVQNSQGTPWLPGSLLGTFYSKGTYLFDGVNWVDGLDEVSEELQNILDTMNTQDLAQVLIQGNITGANDIITSNDQLLRAANGGGSFELRANNVDGSVETLGDSVYQQAGQFGSSNVGYLGINPLTVFFGLFKQDFTKSGQIQLTNNDTSAATVLNLPQYVFMASVQNGRIEIGVVNSGIGSGLNTIGKTDNTWYSSQIGYNSGEAGELIVNNTPSTTDYTQTHQADNGDIALTKNIAISQAYTIQSIITAPTITSDQDNYSPAGFDDDTDLIRVDVDANNRSISGIPAPPLGVFRILGIKNINTASLDLRFEHNNAGSLPENRFLCRDNNSKSIKPNDMALWFYDHNVERWTPFNRIG
jgi:hypothetical protein